MSWQRGAIRLHTKINIRIVGVALDGRKAAVEEPSILDRVVVAVRAVLVLEHWPALVRGVVLVRAAHTRSDSS